MTERKYNELKKEVQRLRNTARHFMQTADGLSEMLESLNPSNPIRKRKTPTLDELTQQELQNIINKRS